MKIDLYIMSGAGNIFSVMDNRKYQFSKDDLHKLTPSICGYARSKPTEGLIVLNNGDIYNDFSVYFFNPDGSYGAMCGNGARCAVKFAATLNIIQEKILTTFIMADTRYSAIIENDEVTVYFPDPLEVIPDKRVMVNGEHIHGGYVNVGSDHFVTEIITDTFSAFPLVAFALPLRHHTDFLPRGVNVNIYTRKENDVVCLRTYERGVEAETGACGTGAISTAIYCSLIHNIPSPICLIASSGQQLTVGFTRHLNTITDVYLRGGAEILDTFLMETA